MKIPVLLITATSILELAVARSPGKSRIALECHGRLLHRTHERRNVCSHGRAALVHYVDQHGQSISTATVQPVAALPAAQTRPATGESSTCCPTGSGLTAPNPSPLGNGITYSPFTASGGCKNQGQVNADFLKINGFSLVRIYGVECNQVTTVLNAVKGKGMRLFAGVYDLENASVEIGMLIAAAKANWDIIDTISIGNELVSTAKVSPTTVVRTVHAARAQLRAAGYNGPVVTVDTSSVVIKYPELCLASDYAAVNCHAFFAGVLSSNAGPYVSEQRAATEKACGGRKTVITETGWPRQGSPNGQAVPSKADQEKAIGSLKATFSTNPSSIILFTAFDDMWKKDTPETFGGERFYGILGSD